MTGAKWSYDNPADMLALARESLEQWRLAPAGRAAERKAAKMLAFAFGRLDDMGVLAGIGKEAER